jgi:pyruvate/2-oxoglutarate dehydrogenase complex dihydrolipoamide dehydrogenase (E3) component
MIENLKEEFEAVIIGAGQAGVPLAKKLAQSGLKTAIIEKRLVGGTCINDGCTPTKAMVASARMAYLASKSEKLGVEISYYKVDFKSIMDRKSKIVEQFREGSISGIEKTENLTLIYGEARFKDDHTLEVFHLDGSSKIVAGRQIFINTGASPVVPEIEGVNEIEYLTSTSILELEILPEHLIVVGGGYIGLEFGQMFKRFGAKVTLLEKSPYLMRHEDDDVCEEITSFLKEDGLEILTDTKVIKFSKVGESLIEVTLDIKGEKSVVTCSHVLLASGRKPQTENLGLSNTAVTCDDRGHINVNEYLETDAKDVYALGDVKGGPAFTHISYNDYVVVTKNLLDHEKVSIEGRLVPYCMFTDPQLGRVGITENEAKEKGLNYLVAKIPMKNVARAIETSETRGFMKAIVDKDSKLILGVTIIGEQGGETMTVLQMAMMGKITYDEIRYAIFAHPLYAESLNNLFMSLE